jgi:type II secretory pathway pseudopilin PulG
MKSSARPVVAILLVVAAAIAFWTLALSPKRSEADKLEAQIETLNTSVESARSELAQATAARHQFPTAYHQLVELGQAVPATDETPSLFVELETLALGSGVSFEAIQLEGEGEGEAAPEVATEATSTTEGSSATGTPAAQVVPATEVEASLLPLGASIGTAGLAVMPYTLTFDGEFFGIAKFIGKVDDLVASGKATMAIDGRLITISGFSLTSGSEDEEGSGGGPTELQATFNVTTYLTPPGQGVTAGATPSAPTESSTQTVAAE